MVRAQAQLVYVHDPMCSWCYAFGPVLTQLQEQLPPGLLFRRLLGGLARTTDQPMPSDLREQLAATWLRIEQVVPGTQFNHDFWTRCRPRRSTWLACQAVIAARSLNPAADKLMTEAIQRAYYRQARNPSDREVLVELAVELHLPMERFSARLDAPGTRHALESEMQEARSLGVDSYPALVLLTGKSRWPIAIDYRDPEPMLETIQQLIGD